MDASYINNRFAKGIERSLLIAAALLSFILGSYELSNAQNFLRIPFIRRVSPSEYNAGIQNYDIKQDRNGLLYVANNFGLLQYDGSKWFTYPVKNGTKVRALAIDPSSGKIYCGNQGDFGYFIPDIKGQLIYTSLADSLPSAVRNFDETWNVFIDNDKVYFCTFSRIYIYDGKKFVVTKPDKSLDLSFFIDQQLYTYELGRGLTVLEGDSLRLVPGGDFFASKRISSILPLGNEGLLISTFRYGIFELNNGIIKEWAPSYQTFHQDAIINCMIRLKTGEFAIGTQGKGLLIVTNQGNPILQLNRGKGLESNTILSIYEDDINNIWIGQNNGLAYTELNLPFTILDEQSGLPGTGYAAYLDFGKLYLGTNTGLYWQSANDETEGNFSKVGQSDGQVYHIKRYDKALLMGHQNGAYEIINNQAVQISDIPGYWVFLQLRNRPDHLIGGTYTGLSHFEKRDGSWHFKNKISGFNESSRVMEQDADGNIWVTHGYKGAYKLLLNDQLDSVIKQSYYDDKKGFPSNKLINIFRIGNGNIFTSERGIYAYNKLTDDFKLEPNFTKLLGPDSQIWHMQEDELGNIYFIGRDAIGVLKKNSLGEYVLVNNSFNVIKSYLNDDLENITILSNEEVLFGAKFGFIHFDPKRGQPKEDNYKAMIRKVTLTNIVDSVIFYGNYQPGALTPSTVNKFPYSQNSINFNYSACSFSDGNNLMYQYYLEGYEKKWSNWTPATAKGYTNLAEGNYTFHVRAKNIRNEVSTESIYRFNISPPWYRHYIAYFIYSISVITLLYSSYLLLKKKYRNEQRLLTLLQKKELLYKEHEIKKVIELSQEEIMRLQNEKLEADLRHKNKELATSTMHLLSKNEFITGIKSNLKVIVKDTAKVKPDKELTKIIKNIEANISKDSDWDQFQFHFDQVHGNFTHRLQKAYAGLTPQETKLATYLRLNLSTKEIAQLLNISIRGVEIGRYRLRKKLNLERDQNLQEFILNF